MSVEQDGNSGGRPIILGAQMAAAEAAEAAHQAEPHGTSPLAGVSYQAGLSLIRFSLVAADGILDEFANRFTASGSEDRQRLRSALTIDDFYTVLTYARRAVVRALRDGDESVASRAAGVLAAIDIRRIDERDLAVQAALLSYAIGRVSGDTAAAFEVSATIAEGEAAELLRDRARRPVASLSGWGFREISTAAGIALVDDYGGPYEASADLLAIADAVAAGIEGDTWRLGQPTIGAEPSPVWLKAADPGEAIESITGCISVQGKLVDQGRPGAWFQFMLLYLAETESPAAAEQIARAAGPGGADDSFATVSAAAGPLCAVLISRSVRQGLPSTETQESLERFRRVLMDALASPGGCSGT